MSENVDIINSLYERRIAPIKLFDSKVIDTCYNITSKEQRELFFHKFKNKGGIYLIQYKGDPNIYYIGRAKIFQNRLATHLKTKVKDKFHLFANLIGLSNFNFSIIEVCDLNVQKDKENDYLKKYLPLLNTLFKSNFTESQIYETLYSKLKAKQDNLTFNNTYFNNKINPKFIKYDSINTLSKEIKIARETIKIYLNTHVPYNNNLFFTEVINDFNLKNSLINESKKELELDLNKKVPKKV